MREVPLTRKKEASSAIGHDTAPGKLQAEKDGKKWDEQLNNYSSLLFLVSLAFHFRMLFVKGMHTPDNRAKIWNQRQKDPSNYYGLC